MAEPLLLSQRVSELGPKNKKNPFGQLKVFSARGVPNVAEEFINKHVSEKIKLATSSPPVTYYADALPSPMGIPIGQVLMNIEKEDLKKKTDSGQRQILSFREQIIANSTAAPSENDINPFIAKAGNVLNTANNIVKFTSKKPPVDFSDSAVLAKYKTLSYPEIFLASLLPGKKYEAGAPKKGMLDSMMLGDDASIVQNLQSVAYGGDYIKGPSGYDHLDIPDIDERYQRPWSKRENALHASNYPSVTFVYKKPIDRADAINLLPPLYSSNETGYIEELTRGNLKMALKDLVTFALKDIRTGKIYFFRSFITGISDSFSPSINNVNYLGNPNTFYTYGGLTRTISVNLKIHAFSKIELEFVWKKCQDLAELVSPMIVENPKSQYYLGMIAPIVELTIGNYIVEQPCIISSLSFTIEDSVPWEIDAEDCRISKVPHGVSVSLSFNYIGKGVFTTNYRYFDTYLNKQIKNYEERRAKMLKQDEPSKSQVKVTLRNRRNIVKETIEKAQKELAGFSSKTRPYLINAIYDMMRRNLLAPSGDGGGENLEERFDKSMEDYRELSLMKFYLTRKK